MRLREDTETAAGAALKIYAPKTRIGRGEHIYRAFGARQGRYAEPDRRRYGRGGSKYTFPGRHRKNSGRKA